MIGDDAAAAERERFRSTLDQFPAAVAVFRGPDLEIEQANGRFRALAPAEPAIGRPARELFAAEGASGWLELLERVQRTGEPIEGSESRAVAAHPEESDARERFFDVTFVPLRDASDRVDGVLVHAVDVTARVQDRRRAESSEQRYTTLAEANVFGVAVSDEERFLEANEAFLHMIGATREELERGELRWPEMTPPEWADADARAMRALRGTGRAESYEKEYVRRDGGRVPVLVNAARLSDDPLRAIAVVIDLRERKAGEQEVSSLLDRERDARFAAELAEARMGRLQEITASLSASISPDAIARSIVHHALEDLSAAAGLLTVGEGAAATLAYGIGFDADRVDGWRRYPATLPAPLAEAVERRRPVVLETAADWAERLPGGEHPDGHEAFVAVPLEVGERTLGALGLAFREPRALRAEDRDFLLSLALQAAQALERAQLYENRAYVARKLQEGLLPERLETIPGIDAAVRYSSISGGGEVGGDFYDVFVAGDGRLAVAIGDVCGKGTQAAVITGLARHTLRAVAWRGESPVEVLRFLNGAIRRHAALPAFCTVGCGMIEPVGGGRFRADLASGGHPYPLLVRPGEPVTPVVVTGTMLGVAADPQLDAAHVDLEPGDALVFYTDGVVDARYPGGEHFGEERLLAAVEGGRGGDAETLAAAVEAAVATHHGGPPTDDRAILVIGAAGRSAYPSAP